MASMKAALVIVAPATTSTSPVPLATAISTS